MGIFSRLQKYWGHLMEGWNYTAPPLDDATTPLREAAGVNVDEDDGQWRRLTGDTGRDLSPLTQERMQRIAASLWESNLVANRLVELMVCYILAEGVRLSCKNEDYQKLLNRFWRDPINDMPTKLPEKVRELSLFGEQCYPVFVNDINGAVKLGYLDPKLIATVVMDPDNPSQVIGIVTKKDKQGRARRYRVIINGAEDNFTARTQEIRKSFVDGECWYLTINKMSAGSRGRSDLLAQADWLDAYDQFLFGELDRARFMRSFFWDVTLTGATDEQVKKRSREITAPAPGTIRVHNENEAWKAEAPDLKAGDSSEHARLFRNHSLGGATIPEHWFGGGGDVNRAVGAEMGEPTFKVFSMRQGFWKSALENMGRHVIRLAALAEGNDEPDFEDANNQVEAIFPELTARDTTKWASALQQVATAIMVAVNDKLLTRSTAVKLLAAVAGRLGVEIDADAELKAVETEHVDAAEKDVFKDAPPPPDPAVNDPGQAAA